MPSDPPEPTADDLRRTADRCDELAQTAELMGDEDGANRLREVALTWRMRAMTLLDHSRPPGSRPPGSRPPGSRPPDR